jgi:acetylornithine/N-succinyldiaminopimelate aminotransferase
MIVRENLVEVLQPGDHASTFGGNPLATAVARTVLEAIDDEGILEHCDEVGRYFLDSLKALQEKHMGLQGARGCGLMLAIDLDQPARPLVEACLQEGLIVNAVQEKTLRFVPPLIITKKQIDEGLAILKDVLEEKP